MVSSLATNVHTFPAMAIMSLIRILTLGLLITLSLDFTGGQIGVNYGRVGYNLPPPSKVVALYKRYGIQRMRIYDTDPATLQALCGSNIELTVGVLNADLQNISTSQANAEAWVQDNICKYPTVDFRHIIVGNEVSPISGDTSQFARFVLPAIKNIYKAISDTGLDGIKVTTAIDTGVLDSSQNTLEKGRFRSDVAAYLDPIIQFFMDTDTPIFASLYPYFAYANNPKEIDLRYALLDPCYEGVVTSNGVKYQNLFYTLVDEVYSALEKSAASLEASTEDGRVIRNIEVKGAESGWPSRGGRYAHPSLARIYANNLVQAVKNGTPKRPDQPIETYFFAMFDEDLKPGNETERHFGLFSSNGRPKYSVNFN